MASTVVWGNNPIKYSDIKSVALQFSDVKEIQFLSSEDNDVVSEDIGRGDVNFTYRCSLRPAQDDNSSVFVKYSPPYVKTAPAVELTNSRLKTEYFAMLHCHKVLPGSVAKPLCYSPERSIAMFEFLNGHVDLEPMVVNGQINPQTFKSLAKCLGILHNSSHVNVLPADKFSELRKLINCDEITQKINSFYFDTGYFDETALKELKPEHAKRRDEFLNDSKIRTALDEVRSYCNIEECLIHNDLHFNSVMVKDNVPKLTDFEFARIGNPARDVAMVIAMNIAFYYYHLLCPENNTAHRQMAYKLLDMCKQFVETYYEHMTARGDDVEYRKQMARHVTGFVGVELASRFIVSMN